ncbi:CoA transferase [Corynebacterium suedekumii]|nr:CoA transferase [Corynebacterium suedekumii]
MADTTVNRGALYGIRVLDISRVLAGPSARRSSRISAPRSSRSRPPGETTPASSAASGESTPPTTAWSTARRSGITLDLKSDEGRETLLALAARSDVVVENFRPGVMERLGISAATLIELNPRLVVTSISGFGQTGSMSAAPAYDLVAQALSGIMSVTGQIDGGPTRVGISLGDIVPGLYAAIGTLGALMERQQTGRGQHVDLAMYDSLVSVLESVAMRALYEDGTPTAVGNDHAMTVPFSTYAASDGDVVITVSNERLFATLAKTLGLDYMLDDPRYATNEARVERREEVRGLIEGVLSDKTVDEALDLLRTAGIPSSKVVDVEEAINGPSRRNAASSSGNRMASPPSLHHSSSPASARRRTPPASASTTTSSAPGWPNPSGPPLIPAPSPRRRESHEHSAHSVRRHA